MTDSEYNYKSDDLLNNFDAVANDWLKNDAKDFVKIIIGETREEVSYVKLLLNILSDDPELATQLVKSAWASKTVEEQVFAIIKHLDKILQIMKIAWIYSETGKLKNTKLD